MPFPESKRFIIAHSLPDVSNDTITVTIKCELCDQNSVERFDKNQYLDWVHSFEEGTKTSGKFIQDIMPEVSAELRDFLVTGVCLTCQALLDAEIPQD